MVEGNLSHNKKAPGQIAWSRIIQLELSVHNLFYRQHILCNQFSLIIDGKNIFRYDNIDFYFLLDEVMFSCRPFLPYPGAVSSKSAGSRWAFCPWY